MKKGNRLLQLFLYGSLVSLVWLGAYVGLSSAFAVEQPAAPAPTPTLLPTQQSLAPMSAYWSAVAVVDGEGEVTEFFLRYTDFLGDATAVVRVPVDTKAELAGGAWEVLRVHNPELPELFMISELCRLFTEDTRCMAVAEVGSALLGERPKTVFLLEEPLFQSMIQKDKNGWKFALTASVKDTIVSVVKGAATDTTLAQELVYTESYRDMKQVLYRTLPGSRNAQEFVPDYAEIAEMMQEFRVGNFTENE